MGGAASSIKEMPERMAASQKAMQLDMQERMRRAQMSQQMAIMRERTWWFAGTAGSLVLLAAASRNPKVLIPVFPLGIITAYHWDFGYGDKINRIAAMHEDVLRDPRYFFHDTIEEQGRLTARARHDAAK